MGRVLSTYNQTKYFPTTRCTSLFTAKYAPKTTYTMTRNVGFRLAKRGSCGSQGNYTFLDGRSSFGPKICTKNDPRNAASMRWDLEYGQNVEEDTLSFPLSRAPSVTLGIPRHM